MEKEIVRGCKRQETEQTAVCAVCVNFGKTGDAVQGVGTRLWVLCVLENPHSCANSARGCLDTLAKKQTFNFLSC